MSGMILDLLTSEESEEDTWDEISEGDLKAFRCWVRGRTCKVNGIKTKQNKIKYLLHARKEGAAMDNEKIA